MKGWGPESAVCLRSLRGGTEYKNPSSKEIRKKYEKITKSPTSGLAPKIRKKKPKNYKNGHFLANSVIFRYFFRIFGAKPEMGDFVIFSYFFRISLLEGFLYSVPPRRDRNGMSFETQGNQTFWQGCPKSLRNNSFQQLKKWRNKKTDKEKSNKGIWRSDAPEASQGQTRDVPGTPGTFGPDLCVNQY